jgi:hypothetical protein
MCHRLTGSCAAAMSFILAVPGTLYAAAESPLRVDAQLTDRAPQRFLTPMSESLFLPRDHPRVHEACRFNKDESECPLFLRYGSSEGGPGPFIPPSVTANLPHLYVAFALKEVTNVLVAGEGVGTEDPSLLHFRFEVDSSASSSEEPTNAFWFSFSDFAPGMTRNSNSIIWHALVLNGCVNPPAVIPVDFRNSVGLLLNNTGPEQDIGVFEAEDHTSLVSTGFWNFEYALHAVDSDGDASDLRVEGKVSVVCTAKDALSY